MFGWEGPDQVKHRFYEIYRDAIHQGNDYDVYHVDIRPGPPEEFLKGITPERMEFYHDTFGKIYSELAKTNGKFELDIGGRDSSASMTLRGATDLHPYQLIFKTGADPIIEALLVHIAYSRLEGCRIRQCDNCGTIFIREGKKPRLDEAVFCGITCARAAATKRYRAGQKAKDQAAKEATTAAVSKERHAPVKKGKSKRV